MPFLDKAREAVETNIEKVGAVIDTAGDFVDDRTGGKFTEAVDKVQDAAKGAADKIAGAAESAKDAATDAADKATGEK